MLTADQVMRILELKPLPVEGGFYRETYRSPLLLDAASLGPGYRIEHSVCTAMYYLLTPETFSALHRLPTDEVFHFYLGDPVEMLQLLEDGTGRTVVLGSDVLAGQTVQVVAPRRVWLGSALLPGGKFALMGTTMAPGFDYSDYEGGDRQQLTRQYPAFAEQIARLTR